jgi:hypothetical protein
MIKTLFYGALIAYGLIVALLLAGYALKAHHLAPPSRGTHSPATRSHTLEQRS